MVCSSGPRKIYLPAVCVGQTRKPQRIRTLNTSQGMTKRDNPQDRSQVARMEIK